MSFSISIHAPRVGGDKFTGRWTACTTLFQSTPPVWGATCGHVRLTPEAEFQSTPPVWGATEVKWS